jgi:hypothetical protein
MTTLDVPMQNDGKVPKSGVYDFRHSMLRFCKICNFLMRKVNSPFEFYFIVQSIFCLMECM